MAALSQKGKDDPMVASKKKGKWYVDFWFTYPDGKKERIRRLSPSQTKRDTEEFERRARHELLLGVPKEGEPAPEELSFPSVEDFAPRFLEGYASNNNKPSEICAKERILRVHLVPFFGTRPVNTIGGAAIEEFKRVKLQEGLAKKTVNNCLVCLGKLMRVIHDDLSEQAEAMRGRGVTDAVALVAWSPPRVKMFKLPSVADSKADFLTAGEAQALIGAARDPQLQAMITVALSTGLRLGELKGLQWCDVDLEAGRIVVRHNLWNSFLGTPKSGRNREVPLSEIARHALGVHRSRAKGTAFVFCNPDGSPLSRTQCAKPLKAACRRAGIRQIGWHVMRHTFASHLVMASKPMRSVQKLLGHATVDVTERYAHLAPEVNRDAVSCLDEILGLQLGSGAETATPSS